MTHFWSLLFNGFGHSVQEVFLGLLPIVIVFIVLQITGLKLKKQPFKKIMFGFIIVFVGLSFFMQGVNIAFLPVGKYLGETIAALPYRWVLIPLGFVMGFLVAFAEPAVHVMIKQVEDISSGAIKSRVMLTAISLGVAIAVSLSMMRLVTGISLWWFLIPGYITVFVLSKFVSPVFVAMAFDNGGVATGPMCSTFILSMSVAIASTIDGRDPLIDGFGVVALIALAPIITTMLLSFIYNSKSKNNKNQVDVTEV